MPTLPAWARGGRIIYDTEYNLAYIRTERRGEWRVYTVRYGNSSASVLARTSHADKKLDQARTDVFKAAGDSIENLVHACHPGAKEKHLSTYAVEGVRPAACGAPDYCPQVRAAKQVTCPLCLAVLAEDVDAQAKKVGVEAVAEARQAVVSTRETNALGKLVTGEPATEHEL